MVGILSEAIISGAITNHLKNIIIIKLNAIRVKRFVSVKQKLTIKENKNKIDVYDEKLFNILKGLLDTDGSNKNELVFDSTSYKLIEAVRYLCMRLGVLTSGYIRDRRGQSHETQNGVIENKKISYCLRIPKTKEICELMNIQYNENQFFKFIN